MSIAFSSYHLIFSFREADSHFDGQPDWLPWARWFQRGGYSRTQADRWSDRRRWLRWGIFVLFYILIIMIIILVIMVIVILLLIFIIDIIFSLLIMACCIWPPSIWFTLRSQVIVYSLFENCTNLSSPVYRECVSKQRLCCNKPWRSELDLCFSWTNSIVRSPSFRYVWGY